MPKRKKWPEPSHFAMYSWTPETRATAKHIKEAVRVAIEDKKAAFAVADRLYATASQVSRAAWDKHRALSIHALARQHLEYWRHRAFMPGAYGLARYGDRPAAIRWDLFV